MSDGAGSDQLLALDAMCTLRTPSVACCHSRARACNRPSQPTGRADSPATGALEDAHHARVAREHIGSEAANAGPRAYPARAGPRCQQADKNRVSQVTDSRIAAQHANGSWPFQTGRQMGRAPPPGHHGRAEGRYMPKAGKTSPSARDYHCIQARARTDEFGQYRYVCTRMNRSQIFL